MSESPNQAHQPPPNYSVFLWGRLVFITGFVLIVMAMTMFTPQMAQQIAYSWNIGVEQAKADVARQFLAGNPDVEQRVAWVAKAVAPSVVGIHVISVRPSDESDQQGRRSEAATLVPEVGSGVIIDAQEGYILTNYHVIANAHVILVRLSDGREVEAGIVGQDRIVDLAVLQIDIEDIEAISWGDSQQVTVGEQVLALGSPYGLQQTVTSGIISATGRYDPVRVLQGQRRGSRPVLHDFLQTDAAINPGNSGGALVDMNGKLIGINTSIITMENGGGNTGIGFAIPSGTAKYIFEEIVAHGQVQHGWIGVELSDVTLFESRQMNQKKPMGAIVSRLTRGGSPASEAGLQRGDIVLQWGETEINNSLHLVHLVTFTKPGTQETVEVFRQGEFLTFEITVGVRPTNTNR